MTLAGIFSSVRRPAAPTAAWLLDRPAAEARSWRRAGRRLSVLAGLALLGALWGAATAVAGLNALFLAAALIGCVFILRDFRIGVVLLILLLPISRSYMFPHAMLGINGLNPLNLLFAGTLGSCLLHGLFDGSIRRFLPRPLLWLYIAPILIAGAMGSRRVGDIAAGFFMIPDLLQFDSAAGYIRETVLKPLMMVVFALLVGAAVQKSDKPERVLIPTVISIWVMGSMVVVFFLQSGAALGEMASSGARGFLSPLGLHANELGRLYALAYALLLFTWAESKEPGVRLALLASMGLIVVALMLTFSRGAFLGFIVVNALFLLWRRSAKTLIFVGLLVALALLALPDAVYDRVTAGFGEGLNAISAGRIDGLWRPLLPEILRSPIYGSGLWSTLWSDAMRAGAGVTMLAATHPHNAYLEAVLDMGIAGLILLCAYFAHAWKGLHALSLDPASSPILRGFYLGAMAGLASFLIAAVVDGSLAPKSDQVFLWLAIGMMYGQRARNPAI